MVTGSDGKARVRFRAPTAVAEYRLTARGVTGADTLVGQSTADLSVRKAFFVELRLPPVLTEGDEPRLLATLHHRGIAGPARVVLKAGAAGREEVFPRTVELKADGLTDVLLDAFRVTDADLVRLTVSASAGAGPGAAADEVAATVPIRPWGVPVYATASGRSSDDATVFVGLPPGRRYEGPEMRIVVSPRPDRMVVDLALSGKEDSSIQTFELGCAGVGTTLDRASELLGAAAALGQIRISGDPDSDNAPRLARRISDQVSELVSLQNENGSWSWVVGGEDRGGGPDNDRLTTARVVWALSAAEFLGLGPEPALVERSTRYLEQAMARLDAGDHLARAAMFHALGLRNRARFESVNPLYRERASLSETALAYLAITLARLDHSGPAGDVLDILVRRARTEPAGVGQPPRRYWSDAAPAPGHGGTVETTALVALAFSEVRPGAPELAGAREWLLAHRVGNGWLPAEARGPVLLALAATQGCDRAAEDRYRLVVTVNDAEVYRTEVAPGAGLPTPPAGRPEVSQTRSREIVVPRAVLKPGAENRVAFDIEGQGTFGYAVTLTGVTRDFGPDQDRLNRTATIGRRVYLAAQPEIEGRPIPIGFSTVINPKPFENLAAQVSQGGRVRVEIEAARARPADRPDWQSDFLVLHEHLPTGTRLIEGSVESRARHYTNADGVLTFYFAAGQPIGLIRYELRGDLPGNYRVLPTSIRGADDPGRGHLGATAALQVLSPGAASTDPYKPTPDELYHRGKVHFDAGRLAEAAAPLETLFEGYTLRDDILKDTARMLLFVDLARHDARRIVRDFEIVREKSPELVIAFDTLLAIGRAYAEIGESERAYLGWTALAEASYLEDAQVGELLRQRGRELEGVAFLLRLWRESPGGSVVDSDFFGLAQRLAALAARSPMEAGGATRAGLLHQANRLTEIFLAESPDNPLADEAGLALVGNAFELGDHAGMIKVAEQFARLHPKSTLRDSFRYSEALGQFYLGQLDRAIALARPIAEPGAVRPEGESPDSAAITAQAIALLGRIHEARLEPAEALAYYRKIAARVPDAADAVGALTARSLSVPEISVVRPEEKTPPAGGRVSVPLIVTCRNLAEVDVRVYPVDVTRLFPGRDNLGAIASVELAGIRPLHQAKVPVGDGRGVDLEARARRIELPLPGDGAYLVMLRGDNLFASGLVVVTPLEIELNPSAETGRLRVNLRDARTHRGVAGAQVKVIGSRSRVVQAGETDLRGVFVAPEVDGRITVVVRQGNAQYAVYRSPAETDPTAKSPRGRRRMAESSDDDPENLNRRLRERQLQQLEGRGQGGMGGMGGMMGGGFR